MTAGEQSMAKAGPQSDTLVVFDCFGTVVTESRPMPDPGDFTREIGHVLLLESRLAAGIVDEVFTALHTAMADKSALQPGTRDLLVAALRTRGVTRTGEDIDRALWRALGCEEDDRYALCEPAAEAMRRTADAGHAVRLMSNCYLPGGLMRRLLTGLEVPEVYDSALFTADGGPKKPDPRAFEQIAAGPFRRRVMVGDSEANDMIPARRLGWETVRVRSRQPESAFAELRSLLTL